MTTARCMVCEDEQISIEKQVCTSCTTDDGEYICPECGSTADTLVSLRQHVPSAHDGMKLPNTTCSDCGNRFNYPGGGREYCKECWDDDKKEEAYGGDGEKIEMECALEECENTFKDTEYEIQERNRRFCSQQCASESRRTIEKEKDAPKQDFHPVQRGTKSQAQVIASFVSNDLSVLEPFSENERYDLVVDTGQSFKTIQVKTANDTDGTAVFRCASTNTATARRNRREDYKGDVDYFAVYHREKDRVYLVPISEANVSRMRLRYDEPDCPSPNINWAEDYLLENRDEVDEWSDD